MEIERKWMVLGWPDLPLLFTHFMRQGYISVRPTVRIREEALENGETAYILCFKSQGKLSRKEIELPLDKQTFDELEDLIGLPMIKKNRRTYALPSGLRLEVNDVDAEMDSGFMYEEIEFDTVKAAKSFDPASVGLEQYLLDDVTMQDGQSMGAYWEKTRLNLKPKETI